jgi:hypothetical protein
LLAGSRQVGFQSSPPSINIDMFNIIEDCSPFYVRFTFIGIENFISLVKSLSPECFNKKNKIGYIHSDVIECEAETILKKLPLTQKFEFIKHRVGIFDTLPYGGCGIHKDGWNRKVSFNIPIEIHNELCITKWYDDSLFENMEVKGLPYSRNVFRDFTKMQPFPSSKEMIAKMGEAIIFNTDIYHSFDNTKSSDWRRVLTLRLVDDNISFQQAKEILFPV